jgi:hypothetical protein
MRLQVSLTTSALRSGVHQVLLEADGWDIDPKLGTLRIFRNGSTVEGGPIVPLIVVVYAAGVWRSVSDVGLMIKSIADAMDAPQSEPARENSRRRQEARPIPPA